MWRKAKDRMGSVERGIKVHARWKGRWRTKGFGGKGRKKARKGEEREGTADLTIMDADHTH